MSRVRLLCLLMLPIALAGANHARADEPLGRWIVVFPSAYQAAIEPLCEQRKADGFDVVRVVISDVLTAEQLQAGDAEPLRNTLKQLCSDGPSCVLLVGAIPARRLTDPVDGTAIKTSDWITLPTLKGTVGRMLGQPSDNGFGCLDDKLLPTVAVGRFPARNVGEVTRMVEKTLAFERGLKANLSRQRLALIIGHPGGQSAIEKRFGEQFVQSIAGARFQKLHPRWTAQAVVHVPSSPFVVPTEQLNESSLSLLGAGQLFAFYFGHSGPQGCFSDGAWFLEHAALSRLKTADRGGVLFSCGCFGCQLDGPLGEGYGLSAMRSAGGPVAVIGSHGESYGAIGQLALDGLLVALNRETPPQRLGEYWLATKAGIARSPLDALTFWLYDQADGSRGRTSLEQQRREHLEMWLLLGDPALKLDVPNSRIELRADATARPGETVRLSGTLPAGLNVPTVRVQLERPFGSALPTPATNAEPSTAHARANHLWLMSVEVPVVGGQFEVTVPIPEQPIYPRLILRAIAVSPDQAASGACVLTIKRQP